jgi:hypothetical protein
MDRLACLSIPQDRCFSLIGDADSRDIGRRQLCLLQRGSSDGQLTRPNLFRVMFDPAGLRKVLSELLLSDGKNRSIVIKHDGARTSRSLVEG